MSKDNYACIANGFSLTILKFINLIIYHISFEMQVILNFKIEDIQFWFLLSYVNPRSMQ